MKQTIDTFILSYSQIFFSSSRIVGLFVIVSTMVRPLHGLMGVLGALFSNGFAYLIGMDRESIRKGFYGFNGVLTALAVGFYFGTNVQSIFVLLLLCIILTFITTFMNNIFNTYLGLPALSMPFNIATWLIILYCVGLKHYLPFIESWSAIDTSFLFLPKAVETFFSSLGAFLFQMNALSGIIIMIGIFMVSRITSVLLIAGFAFGMFVHSMYGMDETLLEANYLGYNYMLTMLALGGIFIVPGPGSFFIALIATACCPLIMFAFYNLLPTYLSPLALPFNISVFLVLYALKNRSYPSLGIKLVTDGAGSPEENLHKFLENIKKWRFISEGIVLPFHGKWKVTQGVDGDYTHQDHWRFAYDFQAVDSNGSTYKDSGFTYEDYFSFGLPVLAPLSGKIYSIRDGIPDNQIGRVNINERWGNHVIIQHAINYFSCIGHLRKGSIIVREGQDVRKGELIASCGNSGRSPYPHIHLQFQVKSETGSPSANFEFSNIILRDKDNTYLPKGILSEHDIVENLPYPVDFERFFPYSFEKEWIYTFKKDTEFWKLVVDLFGNTYIESAPKETRLYYQLSEGVLKLKKIEGSRESGLFFFGSLISEVPFIQNDTEIQWACIETADYTISKLYAMLFDTLSLVGAGLTQKLFCEFKGHTNSITLSTNSRLFIKTPFRDILFRKASNALITFKKDIGVAKVTSGQRELNFVTARFKTVK